MNKLKLVVFVVVTVLFELAEVRLESTTSFDSLISSQCKAKCLSLYPWKFDDLAMGLRKRSPLLEEESSSKKKKLRHNEGKSVIWHRVMEKCTKNQNCLQCSLPCDIPTNLLQNCKYLCKHRHPLCIESCNLMTKLSQEKYGTCPPRSKPSSESTTKCTNYTKSQAISALLSRSPELTSIEYSAEQDPTKPLINECSSDSDCADITKCCALNPDCPEHGSVCQKPLINSLNLPSIPFNLNITERKKGKTIILSWDCVHNKNKPTMFVVEGRWSLRSPSGSSNSNEYMTKWGYLAQTVNTNSVILRSVNRGRWYKFRVASISKSGTFGYSQPTELFILSSPPKPPSQPQNLTVAQVYASEQEPNKVNADLSWLPSKRSDLPISNYKISWELSTNSSVLLSNYKQEVDYESDEEQGSSFDSANEKFEKRTLNSPESGSELIDAQNANKFTIKGLSKSAHYVVELVAQSKHENKLLTSSPIRVRLSTHNYIGQSVAYMSEHLKADRVGQDQLIPEPAKPNDYDDEDDDMDVGKSQPEPEQKSRELAPEPKRLIIKNLTVQTPFYQNGLVKANLAWQIEQETGSFSSGQEASINAKTLIDQPMFTITWFPIKCEKQLGKTPTLATPISATIINTHFEIYDLIYNCDYVVNVRLASQSRSSQSAAQSSILQKSNSLPPQIASAQFKVPPCAQIKYKGRLAPQCYDRNIIPDLYKLDELSSTTTTTRSTTSTRFQTKIIDNLDKDSFYNLLYSSTIRSRVNSDLPSIQLSTVARLPRVFNIRYKVVEHKASFYAVEFTWSVPGSLSKENFNGYQINVVPKAVPGLYQDSNESGYIGSIGAIVSKEQQSFVVRQLKPWISYIFQIQTIGNDNLSYGPPNSLDFVFEGESSERQRPLNANPSEKINRIDYDLINSEQVKGETDSSSSLQSSSPSNLNNSSPSTSCLSLFLAKSVFFILINFFWINKGLLV